MPTDSETFAAFVSGLSPRTQNVVSARTVITAPPESTEPSWFLVTVPRGELPEIERYATEAEMLEDLRANIEAEINCYTFFGLRCITTKPPRPHFCRPSGELVPLCDPIVIEFNFDGFMGRPPPPPIESSGDSAGGPVWTSDDVEAAGVDEEVDVPLAGETLGGDGDDGEGDGEPAAEPDGEAVEVAGTIGPDISDTEPGV